MTGHPITELSAFVDGELDPARHAAVEAHVVACAACATAVADLRGLVGLASSLQDRAPQTDLWPGIRDRMAARESARVIPIESRQRRLSFTWTQLAAASVALVVLASGSMWLAMSGRSPGPAAEPAAVVEVTPDSAAGAMLVADYADETYDAAIADLEAALEASRHKLDPETVRTIERNLLIMDQAIAETRSALESDPNSMYLSEYLAQQMQRKLDVLRTATQAATTSI